MSIRYPLNTRIKELRQLLFYKRWAGSGRLPLFALATFAAFSPGTDMIALFAFLSIVSLVPNVIASCVSLSDNVFVSHGESDLVIGPLLNMVTFMSIMLYIAVDPLTTRAAAEGCVILMIVTALGIAGQIAVFITEVDVKIMPLSTRWDDVLKSVRNEHGGGY